MCYCARVVAPAGVLRRFGPLAVATGVASFIVIWATKKPAVAAVSSHPPPDPSEPPGPGSAPGAPWNDADTEPYAPLESPQKCDRMPKPGVKMFRDWVLQNFGGFDVGIARDCHIGKPSHHHEGRAWDWGMDAKDPAEAAEVERLFALWLAPGPDGEPHALFRRAGLRYMIWDKKTWSAATKTWRPYDGYDADGQCPKPPCRNDHTTHVHFSFSWAGANADTSFYDWLRAGQPAGLLP